MAKEIEKREKTEEGQLWFELKSWFQRYRIWVIVVLLVIGMVMGVVFERALSKILPSEVAIWGGVLLSFLVVGLWLRKCIRQIGTAESPAQAIITRFARPVDAVGPGLIVIFWPFEELKEIPTGLYMTACDITKGLYSKEEREKNLSSLPMVVKAVVYYSFPRVDREYSFPMKKEKARGTLALGETLNNEGLTEGLAWGRIQGKELLVERTYYRLPIKNLKDAKPEDIGKIFTGSIEGGIRHVMSTKTSDECKTEKEKIEKEIINYLLSVEGDPFFECGIPKECLSVDLIEVKFSEDIEKAWQARERAIKIAEGIKEELKGYPEGVEPNVAAMLLKEKDPTVIYFPKGGGGGIMDLGLQFEMGRQMAQKRMPEGRRSWEPGEEKPKKEEKEESPHERVQRKYKELKKLFGRE